MSRTIGVCYLCLLRVEEGEGRVIRTVISRRVAHTACADAVILPAGTTPTGSTQERPNQETREPWCQSSPTD